MYTYLQKLRRLTANNDCICQMSYTLFDVTTWNKRFTGLNFLQEESKCIWKNKAQNIFSEMETSSWFWIELNTNIDSDSFKVNFILTVRWLGTKTREGHVCVF